MIKSIFVLMITALAITVSSAASKTPPPDLAAMKAAAEKGDAKAQLEYGKAIRQTSRDEAAVWVNKAADQGLAEAIFWLGYAGYGKEKPIVYYKKSAEMGYKDAFSHVLDDVLFRAGPEADIEAAKKYGDLARQFGVNVDHDTIDRCFEAGPPTIPAADQPTDNEKKSFKASKKDCHDLKAAIGKDATAYRKCILSENPVDNNMVAEIYANGWGVPRNAKLAIALVCHASGVPAELQGMVDTLYATKDRKTLEKSFLFCDHVTSGMNGGLCAARSDHMAEKSRTGSFTTLTKKWTAQQKKSLDALRKTADDFFREHAGGEQDMSGTARAQIAIDEEARLRDELLQNLKTFEAGQLPKDRDFVKADKELNDLYGQIMKRTNFDNFPGAVSKEGIKATQRKWIKYRDAWANFGTLKYQTTAPDTWKTWITKQRIDQLSEFAPSK